MITIWLPDDRPTLAMRVFGSTFVEEIKAQIEIESGIPQDEQRLATGRHSLLDGKTMKDYNITDGTRLWCMLGISGGGRGSQRGVKRDKLKDEARRERERKLALIEIEEGAKDFVATNIDKDVEELSKKMEALTQEELGDLLVQEIKGQIAGAGQLLELPHLLVRDGPVGGRHAAGEAEEPPPLLLVEEAQGQLGEERRAQQQG